MYALALTWIFLASPTTSPVVIEGISLGAPKASVEAMTGVKAVGGKLSFAPAATTQVEVEFDTKHRVRRIYATYRKGLLPLKDFTAQYGEPVKRNKGGNVRYVFTIVGGGTVTLEKESGYPGYYIEAVR